LCVSQQSTINQSIKNQSINQYSFNKSCHTQQLIQINLCKESENKDDGEDTYEREKGGE